MVESDEAPDPLSPVTNERAKGHKREGGRGKREEGDRRRQQLYSQEKCEKGVDRIGARDRWYVEWSAVAQLDNGAV